jgi:transposase-like protein
MNVIGNGADQEVGRWLNNRVENSHKPFRKREGAMSKFRDVKTLQNSAQYMPRSTIISISTAISTTAKLSSKTARLSSQSAANWQCKGEVARNFGDRIGLV